MNVNCDDARQWVFCPICGAKTRLQLISKTELKEYPLFCPKCKKESIINAKNYKVQVAANDKIKTKPDAKTQC